MPYPFHAAPKVGELVEKFTNDFGAEVATTSPVVGPRGKVVIRYLRRDTADDVRVSEPLPDDDDALVGWDQVRRWCRQLDVDPRDLDIGLHLG